MITSDARPGPAIGKRRRIKSYPTRKEADAVPAQCQRERGQDVALDTTQMTVAKHLWHWYDNANAPHLLDSSAIRNECDLPGMSARIP